MCLRCGGLSAANGRPAEALGEGGASVKRYSNDHGREPDSLFPAFFAAKLIWFWMVQISSVGIKEMCVDCRTKRQADKALIDGYCIAKQSEVLHRDAGSFTKRPNAFRARFVFRAGFVIVGDEFDDAGVPTGGDLVCEGLGVGNDEQLGGFRGA